MNGMILRLCSIFQKHIYNGYTQVLDEFGIIFLGLIVYFVLGGLRLC